jgi:hypothetical protein
VQDQRQVETRQDAGLYKYTSDHASEVTILLVTLFAASNPPGTDFTAKLVDVNQVAMRRTWLMASSVHAIVPRA